ncbi:MAG: DedA family protein, partial [Desulfurobacteriaceae bacterium]
IGIFKPQFGKFIVYNGLGAVLWMTSYLLLGNLLEKLFSFIISHKVVSLILSVILLALFVVWRKYGKNKELF